MVEVFHPGLLLQKVQQCQVSLLLCHLRISHVRLRRDLVQLVLLNKLNKHTKVPKQSMLV